MADGQDLITPTPLWPREAEPWRVSADFKFTGYNEVRQVSDALGVDHTSVYALWFEIGVRSRPHIHNAAQVVYYFEGTGVVAVGGGSDVIVRAGQFVCLPANTVHMHGAASGATAAHISIMPPGSSTDFECPAPPEWEAFRIGDGFESRG